MLIDDSGTHNDLPYAPGDLVEPTDDMLSISRTVESAISAALRRCQLYMYVGLEKRAPYDNVFNSTLIFLPTVPLDNTMYALPLLRGMLHMPWSLRHGMRRATRLSTSSMPPR